MNKIYHKLAMVALLSPLSAFAEITGSGTEADPYTINTTEDLCNAYLKVAERPNLITYFVQTADIDMIGVLTWHPLAGSAGTYEFGLNYDGKNHVIRNFSPAVSDASPSSIYYDSSIFGVFGGEIKNLGIVDANIANPNGFGSGILCAYAGHVSSPATVTSIDNVFITGNYDATGNYRNYFGGMVGTTGTEVSINNCFVNVDISGSNLVGGLIGRVTKNAYISNTYVAGSVASTGTAALVVNSSSQSPVVVFDNVAAFNTGATETYLNVQADGDVFTEANFAGLIDEVKSWEAFSDTKLVNGYPALKTFDGSYDSGDQEGDNEDQTKWIEVTLESAGSLGVEVLYMVDKLTDVDNLKVTGPLNSADWTTIKNMTNIVNIDLSGATAEEVPASTFENRKSLLTFKTPQGLKTIGKAAFYNSGITEISLPESVQIIGEICFNQCQNLESVELRGAKAISSETFYNCVNLTTVTLNEGLTSIGNYSFAYCTKLTSINLPSTLVSIGSNAFDRDNMLSDIVFPESLTTIGSMAFYNTSLKSAILPSNVTLGTDAFSSCKNIEEVVLPTTQFTYNMVFSSCNNITRITCPVAVPPTINNDPFYGLNKGNVTLIVPEFAVVNYKLDTYWMQFGTIEGGAVSDYWAISGNLAMTNNRRMDGIPTIDIKTSSSLTVGGSAPMTVNGLIFNHNIYDYSNHYFAQLINNSPAMSAEYVEISIECRSGRWYYLSMPCDIKMSDISHSAGSDFVFRYYDGESRALNGTGNSWKDVPADGTLEAGKAYIYQSYSNGNIVFKADKESAATLLAAGDRSTEVNAWASENSTNAGWNLIGNPFMSYYDMSASNLSCPVTVWNANNNRYEAYSLIDDKVVLTPTQAFFIQQSDSDGQVTFGSEGRMLSATAAASANVKSRSNAGVRHLYDIILSAAGEIDGDRARIVLNPASTLGYESSCDAAKFFSDDASSAAIYSIDAEGNRLAINERPADDRIAALGLYIPATGDYAITLDRSAGDITIHDRLTDSHKLIRAGESYDFRSEETGNIDGRFYVEFKDQYTTTGIEDVERTEEPIVTTDASGIQVSAANAVRVAVYSTDGRLIAEQETADGKCSFNVAKGIYIVRAAGRSVKCAVK